MTLKSIKDILERFIFASRWLQAPMYGGLVLATVLFSYRFYLEIFRMWTQIDRITEELIMLSMLNLLDLTLVANLSTIVVIAGYASLVCPPSPEHQAEHPTWLRNIESGTLKVKIVESLSVISGLHLLKIFVHLRDKPQPGVLWQLLIHLAFLLSVLALAGAERIMHRRDEQP